MKARVLCHWIETTNLKTFELSEFHATDKTLILVDATNQPETEIPTDPNLVVVDVLACQPITLAAIEADPKYHILWSEA